MLYSFFGEGIVIVWYRAKGIFYNSQKKQINNYRKLYPSSRSFRVHVLTIMLSSSVFNGLHRSQPSDRLLVTFWVLWPLWVAVFLDFPLTKLTFSGKSSVGKYFYLELFEGGRFFFNHYGCCEFGFITFLPTHAFISFYSLLLWN